MSNTVISDSPFLVPGEFVSYVVYGFGALIGIGEWYVHTHRIDLQNLTDEEIHEWTAGKAVLVRTSRKLRAQFGPNGAQNVEIH